MTDKWGVEKVVDADYVNPGEMFKHSYGLTKRRLVVPHENDYLEAALSRFMPWYNPLLEEEDY
jgi:hypothetical protein